MVLLTARHGHRRGSAPVARPGLQAQALRLSIEARCPLGRRHIERVAEMRRALPVGGQAADYRLKDENGRTVGLADLFGEHDTLVTYFWMYGPQRERPCPMCTSFLGSLDIPARDITQRVALAVLGRNVLDLTPQGRGTDWYPKLEYPSTR